MRTYLAVLVLAAALAGCRPDVAAQDARDRETPAFRRALEREQVGDEDGAIRAYEAALLDSPRLASAHLQLALLLQDCRKDYMGAIYHYRQYEAFRPDSEKHATIQARIRLAEQLLATQLLDRGDVAVARDQQRLAAEITRLNQLLSTMTAENAALVEERDALKREAAEQKAEALRLRRLVDRLQLSGVSDAGRERSSLPRLDPSVLAAPPPRTAPRASDSPAVAPVPAAAPTPHASEVPPAPPATAEPPPPRAAEPPPAAPRTYVVQPGDSLWSVAERHYGDAQQWKRVRDANRDRIDPDGRLRAGQVLAIPRGDRSLPRP